MMAHVRASPLDERIRELCAKVIAAKGADLEPAIAELNNALREHSQKLREMAAEKLSPKGRSSKRDSQN
jgi:hypothetical protein